MPYDKPLPLVDEDIEPWWKALKEHKFTLFRCKKCGAWYWPAAFCRFHDNEPLFGNMEWTEASGKGKVFVFNIHYRAFHPGFKDDVPYVYALVECDEGPLYGCQIIGCDPKEVYIGWPLQVELKDITDEWTLAKFSPVKI